MSRSMSRSTNATLHHKDCPGVGGCFSPEHPRLPSTCPSVTPSCSPATKLFINQWRLRSLEKNPEEAGLSLSA
ncbi:hypothetical protein L3Q82_021179 [Scortum barcoo]|uniref:Uncharacterized protein n=1 Tax=Scortum barcoo TaxID=214431 RepID=A0ACB8X3Y7_9TELE|nr:hypothetical protein L3Q82_021179 [Scortum barcoo]